jgi:hypothetical protein
VWADISIDFIEGLQKVAGKSVILTVVDRFSKYVVGGTRNRAFTYPKNKERLCEGCR